MYVVEGSISMTPNPSHARDFLSYTPMSAAPTPSHARDFLSYTSIVLH